MGIELTLVCGNGLCTLGIEKCTKGEKFNCSNFRSKSVVKEMLCLTS